MRGCETQSAGLIFGNVAEVRVGGFDDGVHNLFTVIVPIPSSQLWRGDEEMCGSSPPGEDTISTSESVGR